MKVLFKFFLYSLFAIILTHPLAATAATNGSSEAAQIKDAMKLYSEAVPLEINSSKRAELLKQSASILLAVIEKNPKSLDAHRKLMGVYLLQQDYNRGIRTIQDAITLSPEDPKLFITLAFLYEHSGAFEYAIAMLNQALALDPDQELAKEYKLAIQKKIDARNMQGLHKGENVMGVNHGKTSGTAPHPAMSPPK